MSAGYTGLLALTGVWPAGASTVQAGFRSVSGLSGAWVDSASAEQAGHRSISGLSGVWVDSASGVQAGYRSHFALSGLWLDSARKAGSQEWPEPGGPTLAELVMAGEAPVVEAMPGRIVPVVIPSEEEGEEMLLDAWGSEGLGAIEQEVGVGPSEAEKVIRWMAREERKQLIDERARLIDDQNLILILAAIDDDHDIHAEIGIKQLH